jgi:hypothetical protein
MIGAYLRTGPLLRDVMVYPTRCIPVVRKPFKGFGSWQFRNQDMPRH